MRQQHHVLREGGGRQVVEGGVGALAVGEDLDPREERRPRGGAGRPRATVREFRFAGGAAALGHGVVAARARPAQRADEAAGGAGGLVGRRRVLAAPVGVVEAARAGAAARVRRATRRRAVRTPAAWRAAWMRGTPPGPRLCVCAAARWAANGSSARACAAAPRPAQAS
jgi:hypothetical protein